MAGQAYKIKDAVTVWIGGGSIHIKTVEPYGDPVELFEESALELATILRRLVQEVRNS